MLSCSAAVLTPPPAQSTHVSAEASKSPREPITSGKGASPDSGTSTYIDCNRLPGQRNIDLLPMQDLPGQRNIDLHRLQALPRASGAAIALDVIAFRCVNFPQIATFTRTAAAAAALATKAKASPTATKPEPPMQLLPRHEPTIGTSFPSFCAGGWAFA